MVFSSVLLPAPFGPSTAVALPGRNRRVRPRKIQSRWKRLPRSVAVICNFQLFVMQLRNIMLSLPQHDVLFHIKYLLKKLFCFAAVGAAALGAFDDATSSSAHETNRQLALGRSR